ncbi:MAG: hypothetical protein ACYC05_15000 [Sulfuricella sp.]
MTSFARPFVLKCPKCGNHVLRRRLASFNDFGAMGWSDGCTSIWVLNAISQLGKCPWCKSLFWLDDADAVGVLPREPLPVSWAMRLILRLTGDKYGQLERERKWQETPEEWKSAKDVDYPSLDDWWAALENTNTLTPAREMLVRRQLWWQGNDHLRLNRDGKPCSSEPELNDRQIRDNLEALYGLCVAAEKPDRIEIAEILRELGRFDEALALLESIEVDDDNNKASLIAAFARQKDPVVREVWRSQFDF